MTPDDSVTQWVALLRQGDPVAAQRLWERYFARLVGLARTKLFSTPRRAADEEDVALSAFDSFCRNAEQGRFPQLADRDSLWRLLVVITARKAAHLVRDQNRARRGGGQTVRSDDADGVLLEEVLGKEPTPEQAAEVADECQLLLTRLGDTELTQVALWRLEGFSVEEIATKLGRAPRSVKRKLQLIRDIWENDAPA
jgi:DNA-directed RNA polymerase specialized sigma24 family protein